MGTEKWVVFSTFDAQGRSDSCSVEHLLAYRDCGFQTLLIDTSPTLSTQRSSEWDRAATRWYQRENIGYDFGSYRSGLTYLVDEMGIAMSDLDLIITNDSCFGPFISMANLVAAFDALPEDDKVVYGITDSVMEQHHIQSYWLYFRAKACPSAGRFFDSMRPARDRAEAIAFGELALAAYLRSLDFRIVVSCPLETTLPRLAKFNGPLWSTIEFVARRLLKKWKYNRDADTQCLRYLLKAPDKMEYFNPAVLLGVQLYQSKLSPFVKRSLIRDNIYRSPNVPSGLDVHELTNHDVRRLLDKA